MSYEPTTWKDGDLVTSAKLNKIEQGIANGSGGTLVVHLAWSEGETVATMDKTWQQIYDADSVVAIDRHEEDGTLLLEHYSIYGVYHAMDEYSVAAKLEGDSPMQFIAETADSYPVWTDGSSGGSGGGR